MNSWGYPKRESIRVFVSVVESSNFSPLMVRAEYSLEIEEPERFNLLSTLISFPSISNSRETPPESALFLKSEEAYCPGCRPKRAYSRARRIDVFPEPTSPAKSKEPSGKIISAFSYDLMLSIISFFIFILLFLWILNIFFLQILKISHPLLSQK